MTLPLLGAEKGRCNSFTYPHLTQDHARKTLTLPCLHDSCTSLGPHTYMCIYPGATSTGRSQQALNPPWVQGGSGTSSMRLVQKAAEKHLPVQHRYPDQHRGVQDGGLHQSREGYEEAPWMGHGGVHHMEPGHIGQCSFSFCINCHAQLVILLLVERSAGFTQQEVAVADSCVPHFITRRGSCITAYAFVLQPMLQY